MSTITRLFVIALMSVLTNVVVAQTPTSTNENNENEMVTVVNSLETKIIRENLNPNNHSLNFIQKHHLREILRFGYNPVEGSIWKDSIIVNNSLKGDEWQAYITKKKKKFFLTYLVTRNKHLVGMKNIPLN